MRALPHWEAVKEKVADLAASGEAAQLAPFRKWRRWSDWWRRSKPQHAAKSSAVLKAQLPAVTIAHSRQFLSLDFLARWLRPAPPRNLYGPLGTGAAPGAGHQRARGALLDG